jgi:hypothetical protein
VLTTVQPSCADCLQIWEPRTPGTFRGFPGLYVYCFTVTRRSKHVLIPCESEHKLSTRKFPLENFRNVIPNCAPLVYFSVVQQTLVDQCLLIIMITLRHTTVGKTLWKREQPMKRPVCNNTQLSQETEIHASEGI